MVRGISMRRSIQIAVLSALALLSAHAFATGIPQIETMSPWETCDSCAMENGTGPHVAHGVNYTVSTPSMDGRSTEFNINGGFPFADAIWWRQLGANGNVSHFTYDLYFYIKDPGSSEALEFDVNQSTGGRKYTMGTQCGINYDHQWDVWDTAGNTWRKTGIACNVTPYAWNHLTWEFYRANGSIYYVAVTLNGVKSYVNQAFASKSSGANEINVAFQMDQTASHTPYSVWLDNVTLNYW